MERAVPGHETRSRTMSDVVYSVSGMSCGHCESAVTREVTAIPGVISVKAVASTGLLTIGSEGSVDDERVRAAVDEAGYELVGRA
ncbi:heavy-metal-associated domain-containing protein [Streptomyces sp. NBC_00433]